MVFVRKKRIGNQDYYYLVKSVRLGKNKWKKYEKYIGAEEPTYKQIREFEESLPGKIERMEFSKEDLKKIENIKRHFNSEYKKFSKSYKEKYMQSFLIKATYNTNAIEGNTLNLKETSLILKDGISPKGKKIKEIQEAKNMEKCFEYILNYKGDISLKFILEMHKLLMKDIDEEIAGKIRKTNVRIGNSAFVPPSYNILEDELKGYLEWHKRNSSLHPLILASLVHLKLITIHPFEDGNGRVSRLLMNFILVKHKYPMLDIRYSDLEEYYDVLEDCQIEGTTAKFVEFIKKEYFKEYKEYI
jgi:Fic family protein